MSIRIKVQHPVADVHTQNGLAESLIKRLQLIVRPLLMKYNLPSFVWGHTILHAIALIRLRPSASHKFSPLQLVSGREPNLSHLKIFGCAVYVPISPPQRTKMGPQRRLGIYIGFHSPSIIKYLEPLTGDIFTARFADCQFDEIIFPILGGEKEKLEKQVTWNASSISYLDPRSGQCELEVQKIIHLQRIANELLDAFTDTKRVTKSHIPALNAPARIDITPAEITIQRKRGRPIGSKDKNPRNRKEQNNAVGVTPAEVTNKIPEEIESRTLEEVVDKVPEETQAPNDYEISINYIHNGIIWNRNETHVDEILFIEVINEENYVSKTPEGCMHRND
jgi:hypothetical protein